MFIKILFDNWRRFRRPSVIFVPVKCPRGGAIWSPEWTLVWGIWTAFWARVGGNLNNNFQKKSNARGVARGGMLKLRFDRYIILGARDFPCPRFPFSAKAFQWNQWRSRRPHLAVRGFVKENIRLLAVYSRSSNEAFRWQNKYCTKTFCVNLRKLTKEFYVRFVFGIIVMACI